MGLWRDSTHRSAGDNGAVYRRKRELQTLINKHSAENGSDTPDFILAEYLSRCLATFNVIVKAREKWYGR